MWHTGQCLWRRTAMVAQWRSSDHRSQPGCAPGYPHFQPCSRSVWLGWWRLVQHSGKHLHPPWKTEHRTVSIGLSKCDPCVYLSVWETVANFHVEKRSNRTDTSQDMYILSDSISTQKSACPPAKQALYQLISLILIISSSVVDGVISDCLKWKPTYSEGHKGTWLWTTAIYFVSKSGLEAYLLILRQKQFKYIFYFTIEQDISWRQLTIPIVLFRTIKVTSS